MTSKNSYLSVGQFPVDDLRDPDRKTIATLLIVGVGFLGGENEREIHLN